MNYVEHLNLFGVEAKQIPCSTGAGAPTTSTEGAVGCLYMDTLTGDVWKCVSEADDKYGWAKLSEGSPDAVKFTAQTLTDEQKAQARKNIGAMSSDVDIPLIEGLVTEDYVDAKVDSEKSERKAEIAVERARIDNLSTMENGSTSGDAELQDLRVGYDGTIYVNAGTAVREQSGRLDARVQTLEELSMSSVSVKVSNRKELTNCLDGNIRITSWTFPDAKTEMDVTARKNPNLVSPEYYLYGEEGWTNWLMEGWSDVTKNVTITRQGNTFVVNGTANSTLAIPFISANKPLHLPAGTYWFIGCPAGGNSSSYVMQWKNVATDSTIAMDYGDGFIKTFDTDVDVRCNALIYSGYTANDVTFRCQVTEGSDPLPYEDYCGNTVSITADSVAPVSGLKSYADYTIIECEKGGSVTVTYPTPSSSYDTENEDLNKQVAELAEAHKTKHRDHTVFTVSELNNSKQFNQNDFTFVGDELWLAKHNTTYYTNGTMIFRYKVDGENFELIGTIDCDFGHINVLDYCAANDCLIFGNGANDEETEGNYFVVVKNPLSLGETALIADCGIKYDVDVGFKVQALWGDSNLGSNNIVVLLSNHSTKITTVMLGKDADGEFNGTYTTLESVERDTVWGVQGADIWGDTLYIGGQIDGNYAIHEVSLTDYSSKTRVRKFYKDDGTRYSGTVQGIYVNSDYVWVFINTGDNVKPCILTKYRASTDWNASGNIETLDATIHNSGYTGKYVSFYGDSITTYTGYVPTGNVSEYTGSSLGVMSVDETWWKITVDTLGMKLLVNNSWSGRCVTTIRDSEENHINSAGCRLENIQQLSTAEHAPDVIIVKLGVNDFLRLGDVTLGSYNGKDPVPTEVSTDFSNAYALMLNNIRTTYPDAELWCCTINQASRLGFPNVRNNVSLNEINDVIVKLASIWGAKVIRHDECGITVFNGSTVFGDYANNMGLHPNATGHKMIANTTIKTMISK
ncbi:MAG: SGNH/GDSL hydrolase family protein [Bacteroidaceae bacterium]|nr:SGNH/GDSL hydrolase family protein [Bacteroidaceae bacterium]